MLSITDGSLQWEYIYYHCQTFTLHNTLEYVLLLFLALIASIEATA
jgi:hypothetical protein